MKHYAFARADLLAIVLTPVAPAVAMPFASTTASAVTVPTSSDVLQVRYGGRGYHYGWAGVAGIIMAGRAAVIADAAKGGPRA